MIPGLKISLKSMPEYMVKVLLVILLIVSVGAVGSAVVTKTTFLKVKKLQKERVVLKKAIEINIALYKRDSILLKTYKDSLDIYRERTLQLIRSYDTIQNTFIPERIAIDSSDLVTDYNAVSDFIREDPYRVDQ
tara:strand:- start:109 stop:510 length:402 start_codon:yes stop_codon:yes gene_type:complete